jgi:hypothetical protein
VGGIGRWQAIEHATNVHEGAAAQREAQLI